MLMMRGPFSFTSWMLIYWCSNVCKNTGFSFLFSFVLFSVYCNLVYGLTSTYDILVGCNLMWLVLLLSFCLCIYIACTYLLYEKMMYG